MKFKDVQAMRGDFLLELRRHGVLVEVFEEKNLIVNGARQQLARLVGGSGTNRHITQIGFGSGTAAATPTSSALSAAHIRPVTSVDYPAIGQVRFHWGLSTAEANGLTITEFGLICADGTLFSRRVRAPIQKDSDLSLSGAWTIIF